MDSPTSDNKTRLSIVWDKNFNLYANISLLYVGEYFLCKRFIEFDIKLLLQLNFLKQTALA